MKSERTYEIQGPFDIPTIKTDNNIVTIRKPDKEFWKNETAAKFKDSQGCYVFGVETTNGALPFYVGRTNVNFGKEIFNHYNLGKFNHILVHEYGKAKKKKPIIFFVERPSSKWSKSVLSSMEKFLIEMAFLRNPKIENNRGKNKRNWSIKNVVSDNKNEKKPNRAESEFRELMGIQWKQKR